MKIKDYYKEENYIHYSNCHEDSDLLLSNANNPKEILSIASALDNTLAMLLLNPDHILAIDLNPSQIYLSNLKLCGIKYLTYDEFLVFIGVKEGDSFSLFNKIKNYLDNDTLTYFEDRIYLIKDIKLVNCGRFEYYFQIFKNKVMPLIHRKKIIEKFMSFESLNEQQEFYKKKFNNWRFRTMFKVFFSEFVMKRLGRDKEYFKYNTEPLASLLKKRVDLGLMNNLNKDNTYLQYVLLNKFVKYPIYLEKENFEIIKQRIDRIEIKRISFDDAIVNQKFDYMNLSDIFEYMDCSVMDGYSVSISNALNPNGRVIFWNMANKRELGEPFKLITNDLTHDRAIYYSGFYVYEKE